MKGGIGTEVVGDGIDPNVKAAIDQGHREVVDLDQAILKCREVVRTLRSTYLMEVTAHRNGDKTARPVAAALQLGKAEKLLKFFLGKKKEVKDAGSKQG